jgi:hypothetical protein
MEYTHGMMVPRCTYNPTSKTEEKYKPYREYNMCPQRWAVEKVNRTPREIITGVQEGYEKMMGGGSNHRDAVEVLARRYGISESSVKNYIYKDRYRGGGE